METEGEVAEGFCGVPETTRVRGAQLADTLLNVRTHKNAKRYDENASVHNKCAKIIDQNEVGSTVPGGVLRAYIWQHILECLNIIVSLALQDAQS